MKRNGAILLNRPSAFLTSLAPASSGDRQLAHSRRGGVVSATRFFEGLCFVFYWARSNKLDELCTMEVLAWRETEWKMGKRWTKLLDLLPLSAEWSSLGAAEGPRGTRVAFRQPKIRASTLALASPSIDETDHAESESEVSEAIEGVKSGVLERQRERERTSPRDRKK